MDALIQALNPLVFIKFNGADLATSTVNTGSLAIGTPTAVGTPTFGSAGLYSSPAMASETCMQLAGNNGVTWPILTGFNANLATSGISVIAVVRRTINEGAGSYRNLFSFRQSLNGGGFELVFNSNQAGGGSVDSVAAVIDNNAGGLSRRSWQFPDQYNTSGQPMLVVAYFRTPTAGNPVRLWINGLEVPISASNGVDVTTAPDPTTSRWGIGAVGYNNFTPATPTGSWHGQIGRIAMVQGTIPEATQRAIRDAAFNKIHDVPMCVAAFDFTDRTKLFADTARTIPCQGYNGEPVAGVADASGNNWHLSQATVGNRPFVATDSMDYVADSNGIRRPKILGLGFDHLWTPTAALRWLSLATIGAGKGQWAARGTILAITRLTCMNPDSAQGAPTICRLTNGTTSTGLAHTSNALPQHLRNQSAPWTPGSTFPLMSHGFGRPCVVASRQGTNGTSVVHSEKRFFCDGVHGSSSSITDSGTVTVELTQGDVGGLSATGSQVHGIIEAVYVSQTAMTDEEINTFYQNWKSRKGYVNTEPTEYILMCGDSTSSGNKPPLLMHHQRYGLRLSQRALDETFRITNLSAGGHRWDSGGVSIASIITSNATRLSTQAARHSKRQAWSLLGINDAISTPATATAQFDTWATACVTAGFPATSITQMLLYNNIPPVTRNAINIHIAGKVDISIARTIDPGLFVLLDGDGVHLSEGGSLQIMEAWISLVRQSIFNGGSGSWLLLY